MVWHDLLFAHWPVPLPALRELIPPELEVDTYDGEAWLGYGGGGDAPDTDQNDDRRRRDGRQGLNDQPRDPQYNERSAVQIAGYGALSESEAQMLTPEERRMLSKR